MEIMTFLISLKKIIRTVFNSKQLKIGLIKVALFVQISLSYCFVSYGIEIFVLHTHTHMHTDQTRETTSFDTGLETLKTTYSKGKKWEVVR